MFGHGCQGLVYILVGRSPVVIFGIVLDKARIEVCLRGIILKTLLQYGHVLIGIVLRQIHVGKVLQEVFVAFLVLFGQRKISQGQFGRVQLITAKHREECCTRQFGVGIKDVVARKDRHLGTIDVERKEVVGLVVHLFAHKISTSKEEVGLISEQRFCVFLAIF